MQHTVLFDNWLYNNVAVSEQHASLFSLFKTSDLQVKAKLMSAFPDLLQGQYAKEMGVELLHIAGLPISVVEAPIDAENEIKDSVVCIEHDSRYVYAYHRDGRRETLGISILSPIFNRLLSTLHYVHTALPKKDKDLKEEIMLSLKEAGIEPQSVTTHPSSVDWVAETNYNNGF